MSYLLDILCDGESNKEAYSRIESCPECKKAIRETLALEKEIIEANPEMYEIVYRLDAASLEAQAALEKEAYRVGLLDGFKLAMELMGRPELGLLS